MPENIPNPEHQSGPSVEKFDDGIFRYENKNFPELVVAFSTKELEPIEGSESRALLQKLDKSIGYKLYVQRLTTGSGHGDKVKIVKEISDLPLKPEDRQDGYIISEPEVPIIIPVADCPAVVFVGKDTWGRTVLAGLHAGWRGTVKGIGAEALTAIEMQYGIEPKDLNVLITPYASGEKYDVYKYKVTPETIDVLDEFKKSQDLEGGRIFPDEALDKFFNTHENPDKAYLDVGKAIEYQLISAGVDPSHITVSSHRTMSEDIFWSSRKQIKPEDQIVGKERPNIKQNIMCAYLK
jgi:YfiH family protein